MRITQRMISRNAYNNLQLSQGRLQNYSNQLATGKKFQRASENPAGVGRVLSYTSAISRNEQYSMNINHSRGWLENTEEAMQNSLQVMQRVRELTIYASNDSLTAEDRRAILPEVGQSIEHLIGIANTEVNGLYIFGGNQTQKKPFEEEPVYDVQTNYLGPVKTGFAEFASEFFGGHEGEEIGLSFQIDGAHYDINVASSFEEDEIFENIKDAIQGDINLRDLITVDYDDTEHLISFRRLEPGDFSIKGTTQEALEVIPGLDATTMISPAEFTSMLFDGDAGEQVEIEFEIIGVGNYSITADSADNPQDIFDNIEDAIDTTADLSDHLEVSYESFSPNEGEITFTRFTEGDFIITATNEEAVEVLHDLVLNEPVEVNAVYSEDEIIVTSSNISSVDNISPNSFLPGHYSILTESTSDPYPVNESTRVFSYAQSGERLVNEIEATAANRNQSVSFVVTGIDGDNITLAYEFVQMDPAGNDDSTRGRGSIIVDKTEGPQPFNIEDTAGNGVNYSIDLADATFTEGDKIVVNTNADVAVDADLVKLYRAGQDEPLFTFAFQDSALSSGTTPFEFFSLDRESGALLKSSMDLTWDYDFETSDDLDSPAASFDINVYDGSEASREQRVKIEAEGLQNGEYKLNSTKYKLQDDLTADVSTVQQFFQGNAQTAFTGTKVDDPDNPAYPITVDSNVNASILLEVSEVDPAEGTVKYNYKTHQYDLDGNYSYETGQFTLYYGEDSDNQQIIPIGDAEVTIDNLDSLAPSEAGSYQKDDRIVLNITPGIDADTEIEQVDFSGKYRDGESQVLYYFNADTLKDDVQIRHFSLETFARSLDKGKVYDGRMTINEDIINVMQLPQNETMSYDNFGFPVPFGDDKDRVNEISPYQDVTVNLSAKKAFGEDMEVFGAVFDVYGALMDNDQKSLGSTALEKMDRAIDHILERLSDVGARVNRVEAVETTLSNQNLYLQEVRSQTEDIDLAKIITEFTMQENAYRAALATTQKVLQPSLVDYMR